MRDFKRFLSSRVFRFDGGFVWFVYINESIKGLTYLEILTSCFKQSLIFVTKDVSVCASAPPQDVRIDIVKYLKEDMS